MKPLDSTPRRGHGDTTLRCVAVPVVASDIGPVLAQLFALWSDERFAPVVDARTHRPHLMIVANAANEDQLALAEALFRDHPKLANAFSGFSALSADLAGDFDRYERKPGAREGAYGARAGPNFQFFKTMEFSQERGGFTLQIEVDCLPVSAGWVEATQDVIDDHTSAWVIGSVYAGIGELKKKTQSHLNGNALYRTGDPLFQAFLREVWQPRLMKQIGLDYTVPYDCWWALECARASARKPNDAWHLFQAYDPFFHSDPFVVNLLVTTAEVDDYLDVFDRHATLGQAPVFFHGQAMNSVRASLLEHPSDGMPQAISRLSGAEVSGSVSGTKIPVTVASGPGWLESLARRYAEDPTLAASLLRAAAAEMNVNPKNFGAGPLGALDRAVKQLGPDDAVVQYFRKTEARVVSLGSAEGSSSH
ncbi:hypothetical protein C1J03_00250 [Sulfitobacter sp. SK012]|uniref:hypothetical protein n=1 Tax=Sulfitobacter sp. SK012 TaxID=1389005 RepID=UPI000E09EAFC|nr:hypothetical protein [Sulfitobacter sp. SK012]AXI44595.1 hypothetical protein C1J03_00250 [Sulfitobacter sp. SK012]